MIVIFLESGRFYFGLVSDKWVLFVVFVLEVGGDRSL